MLKSDLLAQLLEDGRTAQVTDPLVITPMPDLQSLRNEGSAAIDLRLGTWFTRLKQAQTPYMPLGGQVESTLTKTNYVAFGQSYFLHPHSFVLAVTLEWLRLPANLTASVVGKSSWGRCGLVIATATGVHPGFTGCLTLELANVGEIPIELKPGVKICQLFIDTLDATDVNSASSSRFGGFRRPILRRIVLDDLAEKLSRPSI